MLAIKVSQITKKFNIPAEKHDSLRERFIRLRFKEKYRTLTALKEIDLAVKKGEWLGVIGANGSGKSTLLKIISQIYEPDSGRVEIFGHLVPFLELGVGFNPELPAKDNIYLNGVILGMDRKTVRHNFNQIVSFAGVKRFINLKLKNFSTGMQLRLGFAIAMHTPGEIFLLDEVLAVGDYEFQEKARKVFLSLKKSGKTVIFVSHNLDDIRRWCDRAIWLDHGVVHSQGRPAEVVKQYLGK